ncbi:MAG: hypothetical protein IJC83_02645, partial [Oscillospiraceae bacterium]|nr:hypothetical protein [Oscillospiraceae bacterium]
MNKNLKRRTIALLLALVMVLSMLAGCKNEESGEIASEDDTVMPEMPRYTMSRAEFITRLNDFFGFVKTSKDEFTDVLKDDAFYEDVAKAVGVGYMRPDEENNIRPGDLMSVNDSVLSFSTVLDKDPSEVWETLFQNTDVTLKPSDEEGLDTTSLETMLDRILEGDNAVDGDYGIISSGETLSNKFVTGDVNIENSVGDGFTEITNVLAKQSLNINGGGRDKGVLLDSVHTPLMNIDRPQGTVAVTLDGETYIDETAIYSPCIIVEKPSLEDDGIRNMTVPEDAPDNMTVSFTGDADEILLESPTDLQIISGRQKVVHIRESASGTKIFIDSNAIIDKLIIEGKVDVTGNGTIIEAEVLTDEDISFEKDPNKVTSGKNPDGTDKPLVLSKTKNLTVSLINGRYIVSWNKVFGADSYDVQIFRKEQKFDLKNTAELKLDITDEISRGGVATYRVEVTAKGDGKTTSDPMSSDSFDYKISLKTPENITLEVSAGKATGRWDASADAKKYTVELYKGSKKIYNTETSGTTLDLTKQMTESGPGLYSIKVGATGADSYYINSPKGSSKAVEYNIKLDTPTELELVETTKEFYVKWTASANAKKYRVELYRENKQIVQETVTKTTWDITKYVQENGSGKYYYTVYAEGYGYYLSSDKAKSTEYQLTSTLASPQEIIFNTEEGNIVLQWRPVLNSTSYDVTLLRNGKVVDEQKIDANTTQIDYTELIDNLGVAVYQAKIIANGGPGDLPSDPGFSNEYKHKIRLNTPTNLIFDEMFYSFFAE